MVHISCIDGQIRILFSLAQRWMNYFGAIPSIEKCTDLQPWKQKVILADAAINYDH